MSFLSFSYPFHLVFPSVFLFFFFIFFLFLFFCFFFFSSRRRHTRYIGDWSSDVCSSDLAFALAFTSAPPLTNSHLSLQSVRSIHHLLAFGFGVYLCALRVLRVQSFCLDRKSVV